MSFILKILSMFLLLLLGCSSQEKNIYIESPDKNISVKIKLRPELIGGYTITCRDMVIDASISGRLKKMAEELNL